MTVLRGTSEHGRNVLMLQSSQPTTNAGNLEVLMLPIECGLLLELRYPLLDSIQREGLDTAILGRDSEALAMKTKAYTQNSPFVFKGILGCTYSMNSGEITAETRTPSNQY